MTRLQTGPSLGLSKIPELATTELVELWTKLYGSPPPKCIGRNLLTRAVTHKTQELNTGGDGRSLRKRLKYLGETLNDRGNIRITGTPPFKPGTRLVREWQGKTHEVTVTDDGFIWQDQRYKSLSKVAGKITGSHRSGPAFFGLNKPSGTGISKKSANA